jgi:hypothetical protein
MLRPLLRCDNHQDMVDGSPRRFSQIFDAAAPAGDWMFKKEELVFGPLPAKQLIEKLYAGEISGSTPIAEEGGEFRPLREVPHFTVHLAKAEAKLRVQREADHFDRGERRSRVWRVATVSVLLVSAFGFAGGGAYWLVMQKQQRLQREIDDVPITGNPPELTAGGAAAAAQDDEVSLPLPGSAPGSIAARHPHRTAGRVDPDGLTTTHYETSSIITAELRQKGALIPCIKQELARTPSLRGDVRFSLAVGNDGKVAKLWIDDPQFKDSPLQQCFERVTGGWHFAPYEGERATLSDSFHVGR